MAVQIPAGTPLTRGKEFPIMDEETSGAGTTEQTLAIDADTVLVSVQATVVSGNLDIEVFTETPEGQSASVIQFPTLSAPTTTLQMREPTTSQVMSRLRFRAVYTGSCTFKVRARGLGRGQSNIRIQGNSSWDASQVDVSTTPIEIIPAALVDRQGLVILNNNLSSGKLYIGPTALKSTVSNGYPIGPQQAIALDIDANSSVYGVADVGTIDLRILEAGG